MDRLVRTITCKDEKGRHYTVHVLRKQGSWMDIGSGPESRDRPRRFVLSEDPRRDISPVEGADTFKILDNGTIIQSVEQP